MFDAYVNHGALNEISAMNMSGLCMPEKLTYNLNIRKLNKSRSK